jgi:hypothetical protein
VDEKALRAVAEIAAKDKNYFKWSTGTARKPGKQRGWRQGPVRFSFAAHRRETAKVTTKLNTEVSSAERASSRYVGSVVGHAPLAARGAGCRTPRRATATFFFGDPAPPATLADHACLQLLIARGQKPPCERPRLVRGRGLGADRVVGCTIYDWRLEFTKLRGFWMDNQRGKYDREIFI